MKPALLFLLLLLVTDSLAQTLTGNIKTTAGEILQNTNIIAREKKGKKEIKFAIADNLGRYKLNLEKESNYTITVNHIGFEGQSLDYSYKNPVTTHDFILSQKSDTIKEIIIAYKYQQLAVKKDTLIYDIAAFMNGSERKLKDQLSKLPGMEVTDDGHVIVNGKKVTHFLVEGNRFFGGGTKLGVENIPADAVSLVEVIDHFTEAAHMKEVAGSDELAMNIKLKEGKKKLGFGDLRMGLGNPHFFETHTSVFYFTPKLNWSTIANANNSGLEVLKHEDILRFNADHSLYLRNDKQHQRINFNTVNVQRHDALKNKNQFISTDFRYSFYDKWEVQALFFFNKNWLTTKSDYAIQYLKSDNSTFENRTTDSNNKHHLTSGKLTTSYQQNQQTTFNYNFHFAVNSNFKEDYLFTLTNSSEKSLNSSMEADQFTISQLFEFHKTIGKKHKTSLAISQTYNREVPNQNWLSNQSFLNSHIPWTTAQSYGLSELKKVNQNNIHLNAKHYWIIGIKHHVYTTLGYLSNNTLLDITNEYLDKESWVDLENFGFGNHINYSLNNPYLGLEYKFLYKKFTATLGLFIHHYQLKNQYPAAQIVSSKNTLEPELKFEYEFTKSEGITLNYRLKNNYLNAENYTTSWRINSFNSLFKGHTELQQLQYQQMNLRYRKFNTYSGLNMYLLASLNRKNKNIRNQLTLIGVDQFYEASTSDRPDTNWSLSTFGSMPFNKIEIQLNGSLNFSRYTQVTNTVEIASKRNTQQIGVGLKTLAKEIPTIELHYNKSFQQLISNFDNSANMDYFLIRVKTKVLKNGIFTTDYNWQKNAIGSDKTHSNTVNTYLEFQKKNSPWTFMIKGSNLLNVGTITKIRFSDFMVENQNTYVLPRIVLFSVQYNL